VKTNAVGQQGQYGNGDGYRAGGDDVANSRAYGSRSDAGTGPPNIVAGAPFLVSSAVEPLPPVVNLTPQYVQQPAPQNAFAPQPSFAPQPPVPFQYGVPPVLQQSPGYALPPYHVPLPALTLTARSPSGQYVVPMPPRLYVDKPDGTADNERRT